MTAFSHSSSNFPLVYVVMTTTGRSGGGSCGGRGGAVTPPGLQGCSWLRQPQRVAEVSTNSLGERAGGVTWLSHVWCPGKTQTGPHALLYWCLLGQSNPTSEKMVAGCYCFPYVTFQPNVSYQKLIQSMSQVQAPQQYYKYPLRIQHIAF